MKKNRKKRETDSKSTTTLSPLKRPAGMSLEAWQVGLRIQAARKEQFVITSPRHYGGPFVVSSVKSGRKYRVNYYGSGDKMNRCECMDFKTSGLGTCKHIEAITLRSDGKYADSHYPHPEHTYVYVDYNDNRKIKLHRGRVITPEMEAAIRESFDENATLRSLESDPSEFIRILRACDENFEWEQDALGLLIETRDRRRRRNLMADKYSGSMFQGLIKTDLHPYQAEGVRFAFTEGRSINADEMGLGKTVQAIATAELLRKENLIESVIVICPTSLKYQWLAEIKRFTDSSVLVVEGILTKRIEQLKDSSYFYKICSYNSLSNTIKYGFIPSTDMVIYDELQRLKNRNTQMGKQLRKLESQYVMALSGTPLENKLEELYSVTQLVDQYVLSPLYRLNEDTTLRDELGKIVGYKNLHSVAEKLSHTLIRRRKSDVKLQMPSRTDTNMFVPLTKEQFNIHEENKANVAQLIQKWRRQRFLSEKDRKVLLLSLSVMRMVCDSTFILDQKTRHDTKIEEIMAIVSALMQNEEGKVVIFSQWERMLRILAQELEREGITFCFLHGGVPSAKRKVLIDRFRDDPESRVFLSTDAGATGLNLQSAALLINIDLPWNPAVLEQRIARIWRLGQKNPVQIINMVAKGSIEERMLSTLRFKSDLATGILDGGQDAVFIDNNKFDKIVEVMDEVLSDPAEQEDKAKASATPHGADKSHGHEDNRIPSGVKQPGEASRVQRPVKPGDTHAPGTPVAHQSSGTSEPEENMQAGMQRIVSDGISALGRIAEALRNPESVAALADALVKEDPETGKASLNIPVPDKSTVVNILSAFSAFLKK